MYYTHSSILISNITEQSVKNFFPNVFCYSQNLSRDIIFMHEVGTSIPWLGEGVWLKEEMGHH